MIKLYEDFFDDNAGQLQTSLKGLTDEIDNPADDYDYFVDFYDSTPDEAEKMKDKLETIEEIIKFYFDEQIKNKYNCLYQKQILQQEKTLKN